MLLAENNFQFSSNDQTVYIASAVLRLIVGVVAGITLALSTNEYFKENQLGGKQFPTTHSAVGTLVKYRLIGIHTKLFSVPYRLAANPNVKYSLISMLAIVINVNCYIHYYNEINYYYYYD